MDTSILHLDEMIAQGYRTKKTLVWGTPVSRATRAAEAAEHRLHAYAASRVARGLDTKGIAHGVKLNIKLATGCRPALDCNHFVADLWHAVY